MAKQKITLKNTIAKTKGVCRMCHQNIIPGDEISILVEPDIETEKFIGHVCKPDIHVYHRVCMDSYLLYRLQIGKPVSRQKE